MPTPIRILRAHADDLPNARPMLSARELDREDRILSTARALFYRFGRVNLTFTALAVAMRLAPATIRRHFPDLDSILAEIIIRHLRAIACALGEVPREHPNRQAAARAAYIAFTRNGMGCAPTEAHTLLIRERHTLPPDLLEHIEQLRDLIGTSFAKDHIETTIGLLDNCFLQRPQIEAMLATLQNPSAAHAKIKNLTYPQHTRPSVQKPATTPVPTPPPQARAGPIVAPGQL
jgi:AcrR family transcriptional regulator